MNLSQQLHDKLGCKNIIIDDKKCGNTKTAIQHIIKQVKLAYGVLHEEGKKGAAGGGEMQANAGRVEEESGDEIAVEMIPENDEDSSSEEEEDEEIKNSELMDEDDPKNTSNFVSTIRNPSFGVGSNESALLQINQSLDQQHADDVEMEDNVQKRMSDLRLSSGAKDQRLTRNMLKKKEKMRSFKKIESTEEQQLMIALHQDMEESEPLCNESFFGVFKFLKEDEERTRSPIILIIKNIKMIPQAVLNDLIHLIKKYRGTPYDLKLNLMIGVQNNNIDEF